MKRASPSLWRSAALVLLATALGGGACRVRQPSPRLDVARPIVFAHRGGGGEGPESTIPTMLAALKQGPNLAIELDVRRSADGHLVVIHDASVDRTTNGTGAVERLSLSALQALDAAYCATPGVGRGSVSGSACRAPDSGARFPLRGKGYRIPTLAEVFVALPPHAVIGIEVKAPGFEDAFARQLRLSGRLGRVVVGSALDDVSARLRTVLPEVPHYFPRWAAIRLATSAKLSNGRLSRPLYQVLATPRSGAGLSMDTPGMIAVAHRLGILVAYWTINDEAEMERLFRLGADAIITDYPERAQRVLGRLPRPSAAR